MSLADVGRAHAFVDDLEVPALRDADRHHFERVLRLRPGEPITVSDGRGGWRLVRFGRHLEPDGPTEHEPKPDPPVGVAFALVKGDKPELAVQKLTEVGADVIVPFQAERSVVRWEAERAARHHARLVEVARQAAMQSRRAWLPEVHAVTTFADVAARPGAALATQGGERPDPARHALVLVGPEGGWSPAELEAPLNRVGLGPYVLRAETAAIVAGALLVAVRERFIR